MTPIDKFNLPGITKEIKPYGNGHINDTKIVVQEENGSENRYILQKINRNVFRNPADVMENIVNVTEHIRKKAEDAGEDGSQATLTVIKTRDGRSFYEDEKGDCYRMYTFIEKGLCLEQAEKPEEFYESGAAFGRFQQHLADFPAEKLKITIPDFHNTTKRYEAFEQAVEQDICERRKLVEAEIAFAMERKESCTYLDRLLAEGKLPLRVTHNDTKLNNVMLDKTTGKALCVIDLDTVMPGLSVHDFGDSIRFGANTAMEDETDLSRVSLDMEMYQAYREGFLKECENSLTAKEIEVLPAAARIMTMECGIRFLTDYLNGDTYFKIHREHHNLDRARNQFKLTEDMERKLPIFQ